MAVGVFSLLQLGPSFQGWDPIGQAGPNCTASIPGNVICNWQIGQFQFRQLGPANSIRAIGQLATQPNSIVVGLAKEAKIDTEFVVPPASDDCLRQ